MNNPDEKRRTGRKGGKGWRLHGRKIDWFVEVGKTEKGRAVKKAEGKRRKDERVASRENAGTRGDLYEACLKLLL